MCHFDYGNNRTKSLRNERRFSFCFILPSEHNMDEELENIIFLIHRSDYLGQRNFKKLVA